MKKNGVLIFVVLLLAKLYGNDLINEYECNKTYYAIDNNINIRKEPNTKSKVLGQLFEDEEIYVNLERSSKEWLFCYIPKIKKLGYCYAQYFKYKPYFEELTEDILNQHEEVFNLLASKKVKVSSMNTILDKIIDKETESNCIKVVEIAYNYGCKTDSNYGNTSVTISVIHNYFELTEFLLSKDEFRDSLNDYIDGFAPPLFYALYSGNFDITKLLLDNGADPNSTTRYGWTMFESLAEAKNNKKISEEKKQTLEELLIKYGYSE